jgi:hypothetical protein
VIRRSIAGLVLEKAGDYAPKLTDADYIRKSNVPWLDVLRKQAATPLYLATSRCGSETTNGFASINMVLGRYFLSSNGTTGVGSGEWRSCCIGGKRLLPIAVRLGDSHPMAHQGGRTAERFLRIGATFEGFSEQGSAQTTSPKEGGIPIRTARATNSCFSG